MRKSLIFVLMIALLACVGNAIAQAKVRQITLEWEAIAHLEGDALYNGLCSTCHGITGEGNGPVAGALQKEVPDLRMLAINNDGVYSHKQVERAISGASREIAHGSVDMPDWEQQFMYVNSGWSAFTREGYARKRIHTLTEYVETLQLDMPAEQVIAARP